MGPKRVGLEHETDVAILGRDHAVAGHMRDLARADGNLPRRRHLEPRKQAQQRGLAAARRPQQGDEFAILERGGDVMQCGGSGE